MSKKDSGHALRPFSCRDFALENDHGCGSSRELIPTDFVLPLPVDRKANRDTGPFADRSSDLKLCSHLFGPRLHIG